MFKPACASRGELVDGVVIERLAAVPGSVKGHHHDSFRVWVLLTTILTAQSSDVVGVEGILGLDYLCD
jgi:hypothetical protein